MDYLASRGIDVYALDMRGYGKSTHVNGTLVRAESCARDVKAVVDFIKKQENVDKIFIGGLSYGSHVAVAFAGKHQEDLEGLMMFSYVYNSVNPAVQSI